MRYHRFCVSGTLFCLLASSLLLAQQKQENGGSEPLSLYGALHFRYIGPPGKRGRFDAKSGFSRSVSVWPDRIL